MINDGGPVAIGGIGGSGTRVGAALLQRLGRNIGSDLNGPLDNLWFTLLFKRRSALLDSDKRFSQLCDLFWERMGGSGAQGDKAGEVLSAFAAHDRIQHRVSWLQERVESWLNNPPTPHAPWGWKEPNTHLFIDRLFKLKADLRYIHIARNPIDMALSSNQNQLENWGPVLLDRPVQIGPRDSLTYCRAVARRIGQLAEDHAGRVCIVDFDRLCREPQEVCLHIARFIGTFPDTEMVDWFSDMIRQGAPTPGRGKTIDRSVFAAADLEYVAALGYD